MACGYFSLLNFVLWNGLTSVSLSQICQQQLFNWPLVFCSILFIFWSCVHSFCCWCCCCFDFWKYQHDYLLSKNYDCWSYLSIQWLLTRGEYSWSVLNNAKIHWFHNIVSRAWKNSVHLNFCNEDDFLLEYWGVQKSFNIQFCWKCIGCSDCLIAICKRIHMCAIALK